MLSQQRWLAAWQALGAPPSDALRDVHERLLAAYAERHRHYHTQQHLRECFERLAAIAGRAERPAEVEIALWFHDAIYQPRKADNEQRSADWARDAGLDAGIGAAAAGRIHDLVMATRHAAVPDTPDAMALVDVDLSILGAGRARFDEYERQIRDEYRWVPGFLYRRKRKRILEDFLARPRLFSFLDELEAPARLNLQRAVAALED